MEKTKKPNLNYAGNMDIDAWRERQIRKRVAEHLALREQCFIREHGGESDDELRAYVLHAARRLRRMPHPMELAGGEYLRERLGDWQALARNLGYRPAGGQQGKIAYQRLKQQEEEAFLAERRAKKEAKQQRKANRGHPERCAAMTQKVL